MREYAEAMRERYRRGSRAEKGRLLDEFTAVTGYHRKSAVRLLLGRSRASRARRIGRPRRYNDEVVMALKQVWETADRICGKRLQPFMEELVTKLLEWEELRVSPNPPMRSGLGVRTRGEGRGTRRSALDSDKWGRWRPLVVVGGADGGPGQRRWGGVGGTACRGRQSRTGPVRLCGVVG